VAHVVSHDVFFGYAELMASLSKRKNYDEKKSNAPAVQQEAREHSVWLAVPAVLSEEKFCHGSAQDYARFPFRLTLSLRVLQNCAMPNNTAPKSPACFRLGLRNRRGN